MEALRFALTSNSVHTLMPRVCGTKQFADSDVRKCFVKRKEFPVDSDLVPFLKRRLFFSSTKGKTNDFYF